MAVEDGLAFRIGVFNIFALTLSLALSLYCRYYAVNKYTKRIFSLLSLSSLFELPLYFHMSMEREFTGRIVFGFHIVSNLFYFASFSVLCFAWGDVLRAKNMEELFEARFRSRIRALIVFGNIIFTLHSTFAIVSCALSDTLSDFFHSTTYQVYTISDTCKNFIMGIFILKFGGNLYARVQNYSAFYGSSSRDVREVAETTRSLLTASDRLKVLVGVINFCFALRIVAVIIWLYGDANTENEEPSSFPRFDFSYWSIFETIPVVLPSFTLCFTMGCLAKIFGGVFIDTNNKNRLNSVNGGTGRLSHGDRKRYNSDSSDDSSNDFNQATMKSLSVPFIGSTSQLSGLDEDAGDNFLFNRLSRVSGDLVDIDIERNSGGKTQRDGNESLGGSTVTSSTTTTTTGSSAIMTPPAAKSRDDTKKRTFSSSLFSSSR